MKAQQSSGATPLHAARDQLCMCLRVRLVSGRERDADHPGQIDFAIWLGEQQYAGIEIAIVNHGVLESVQHLQRRPAVKRFDGELPAIDRARHHHVGEEEIDFLIRIDEGDSDA
jgi:hypothetical protein